MPESYIDKIGDEVIENYTSAHNVTQIPANDFIDIMASRFKVSNPAMEYRLKNLGIMN